jgi:hypothetical protein
VTAKVGRFRNRVHVGEPALRIAQRLADHYGVTVETVIEALLLHCAEQVFDADPGDPSAGTVALEMAQPPAYGAPARPLSAPQMSREPGAVHRPRNADDRGRVISLTERRQRMQDNAMPDNAVPAGSPEVVVVGETLLARSKAVRQHAQRLCERAETVRQNTEQVCSWFDDLRAGSL